MRGLVYKSTGSWYTVKEENSGVFYQCRIKGKMRLKGIKNTNPVAVGDYVAFQQEEGLQGVITAVEERQNYIIRKSVNLSKQTHIIAANIDLAFLVVTLNNPPTSTTFIDRFLVTAEAYSIKTVLLFNKVDTYTPDELAEVKYLAQLYRKVGYECIGISATTGKNIEKVKETMRGKTCVVSGHSGTLKTGEISLQHQQGQHTTTFAEMFDLPFGAHIIDTPGIKGFGMVEIDKHELTDYFPEFFALKEDCKFNNCLHTDEPHCAVKEALENDEIAWSRYKSYLQILEGDEESYRIMNYE